ncbi:MAG: FlgO family outer membrane protein [Desulfovibrionaceae bacterium]
MPRYIAFMLLLAALCMPIAAAAVGNVPKAANDIAKQMDKQLMARYGAKSSNGNEGGVTIGSSSADYSTRQRISIMSTVPVSLNNLQVSSPLARQMVEEIARWMINAGYVFEEIRKGQDIQFSNPTGETLLTRDTARLASRTVTSAGVMVGTYVVSTEQVRFNIRILHTPSNEVLAMGTATVPITEDIRPLLYDMSQTPVKVMPSIGTKLQ